MSSHAPALLSRRSFLRAAGVTLSLPFLESLHPRMSRAAGAAGPRRTAFIYTPNGYNQATFAPEVKQLFNPLTLTPSLEPLGAVRDDVTLITGLDRAFVPGTGVHAQCGACWLTSSAPSETLDGGFPTNITLDQLIARAVGQDTMLSSLELSCNDHADNKETKYFESISWYGPGYAANVEKNPRNAFRRLFGKSDNGPSKSVLDVVLADARALHARLGSNDQQKLDEYLESVRGTERRIELAEKMAHRMGKPPIAEPAGIPEQRGDYLRLMGDLIVLAFQNDLTRVATLVVDPERWDSPRMFHGVFDKPQNHHVLTHTKGDEAKEKLTQIDRFHVAVFAYVVEKLKSIREGDGTLLDNTTLVMGSGLSDGDSHNYANLEVLLAGGSMKRGHFHYDGQRPLADLWLTLAKQSGLKNDRFADSTGAIKEVCI
ncbi:MAG: hypothetical protein RL693_2772 [Verrucomicrobiota bacterium]|jgi:hypothetical protein